MQVELVTGDANILCNAFAESSAMRRHLARLGAPRLQGKVSLETDHVPPLSHGAPSRNSIQVPAVELGDFSGADIGLTGSIIPGIIQPPRKFKSSGNYFIPDKPVLEFRK